MILAINIDYFPITINRFVFLTKLNCVLFEAVNEILYRFIIWKNVLIQLSLQIHADIFSKSQVFTACLSWDLPDFSASK
jgi:hypothetical protein